MFVMFIILFWNVVISICLWYCILGDVFVVYVRDKVLDDGFLYYFRLMFIKCYYMLMLLSDINWVFSFNMIFFEY